MSSLQTTPSAAVTPFGVVSTDDTSVVSTDDTSTAGTSPASSTSSGKRMVYRFGEGVAPFDAQSALSFQFADLPVDAAPVDAGRSGDVIVAGILHDEAMRARSAAYRDEDAQATLAHPSHCCAHGDACELAAHIVCPHARVSKRVRSASNRTFIEPVSPCRFLAMISSARLRTRPKFCCHCSKRLLKAVSLSLAPRTGSSR